MERFRLFAIPAVATLSLGVMPAECGPVGGPTETPTADTPTPFPTPTPALPLCEPLRDTVETSDCGPIPQSCCPVGDPPAGADPIAGRWALEEAPYYFGCGPFNFDDVYGRAAQRDAAHRSAAHRVDPANCTVIMQGTLALDEFLRGCFNLYSQFGQYNYGELVQSCYGHDISVAGRPLTAGSYRITLHTTQATLDLNCTLGEGGASLACTEPGGTRWDFERED